MNARPGLVVDLFAGGGGASTGLEAALRRPVDVAINHSEVALAVHAANHPETRHSLVTVSLTPGDQPERVAAFLASYYGQGVGQSLHAPMRTSTTKDRFALVTVCGTEQRIADIGYRMLEPSELLRAQFGDYAEGYDLSAASSKSARVKLIGNSVAPACAAALVRANVRRAALVEVAHG